LRCGREFLRRRGKVVKGLGGLRSSVQSERVRKVDGCINSSPAGAGKRFGARPGALQCIDDARNRHAQKYDRDRYAQKYRKESAYQAVRDHAGVAHDLPVMKAHPPGSRPLRLSPIIRPQAPVDVLRPEQIVNVAGGQHGSVLQYTGEAK
jgi:hypothetical protein